MQKFFDRLLELLKRDKRFFADDGNFLRNAVFEAAMNADENLLQLLLSEKNIADKFFKDVAGFKVFDKIKFAWTINNRQFLPDSYTRFKNKIGLVNESDNFISKAEDVSLVFPYKDCILEGGQTAEDQTRDEIFYNELLARDEIDLLLAPKVFIKATRYSAEGAKPAENFSDDNLIIKGNNLLALASLKKIFAAKVKCIYIDPPFNTGSDSFGYNDHFNHSTWLTFMKNRLEIAKDLLKPDGSIWISIDDDEGHYLKVLADEIFDRKNFVATVIWEKKYSPQNDATWLSDSHDFILVYAKDKEIWRPNLLPRTEEMNARYKNPDNDPRGAWASTTLTAKSGSDSLIYEITTPTGKKFLPPKGRYWAFSKESFDALVADNRVYFGGDGNNVPRKKTFLSEVQDGLVSKTIWTRDEVGDNQDSKRELLNLDLVFGTPKPERLIERILTLATKAGDLVLDYHLGSGTTAAVAHKMGRRYIGVEQMDYIETLTVERLKKVIGGEGGGISEKVGWKGGGSFVYCELAKLNQNFVEAIEAAEDFDTLKKIYERMTATGFISHKVDLAKIDKAAKDFSELTLDNQKKFLLELSDKNLLYVNLSDMDDEEFAISDGDKKFTRSFYLTVI
ncbi:MAG: site-specific DNA-methyltransferase [Selenomonadaceae bacterium]|nr:site-specific DNA-methyltransferase [Selenomonadaceae bacterium]